jgi:hypothetical protein
MFWTLKEYAYEILVRQGLLIVPLAYALRRYGLCDVKLATLEDLLPWLHSGEL